MSNSLVDAAFEQIGKLVDQRQKQLFFVWKVKIDRAFGGFGFDSTISSRLVSWIALVRENIQRSIENALARSDNGAVLLRAACCFSLHACLVTPIILTSQYHVNWVA